MDLISSLFTGSAAGGAAGAAGGAAASGAATAGAGAAASGAAAAGGIGSQFMSLLGGLATGKNDPSKSGVSSDLFALINNLNQTGIEKKRARRSPFAEDDSDSNPYSF